MVDASLVVFGGAFVGGVARSLLPYLRKLAAAESDANEIPFQKRYIFTVALAIVTSGILAALVFPTILPNIPDSAQGMGGIFIYGILATWGATDLFNQVMSTGTAASEVTTKQKVVAKPVPKSEQADKDSTLPIK